MHIVSREQYLNFRQWWKKEYMTLSRQIRALKQATRLASKMGYEAARMVDALRAEIEADKAWMESLTPDVLAEVKDEIAEEHEDIAKDIVVNQRHFVDQMANASSLQSMRARKSNGAAEMMEELDAWKEQARVSVQFNKWRNQQNTVQ